MPTIYRLLLLCIFFQQIVWNAFGQQDISFEHITRDQGLPNNSITAIVQDKYGMMWFSMFNGLVRFNGYEYKYFYHNPKDSNSIADNYVNCLELNTDGSLLIGHENHGFSIFNHETESFIRFQHNSTNSNSLSSNHVFSLHGDKNGSIWIGTDAGLDKLNLKTNKFSHYPILTGQKTDKAFISSILEENDGKLLLFVSGEKIIRFDPISGKSQLVYSITFPKLQVRINKGGIIFKDNQGFLWIGAEFDGLLKFNELTGNIKQYNSTNSAIKSNVIMRVIQDRENRIWVATDGGGLLKYNNETDDFIAYQYDAKKSESISSNAIYTVFQDDNSNIWIGTYSAGLNIIKPNKRRFEAYSNNGNGRNSLSYKSVLSFAEADNGKIWVGTDGGGLNLFDPTTKTFQHVGKNNSGICSDIIKCLARDETGNLWIGTYASGLCVANFQHNQFKQFLPSSNTNTSTINRLNVWALCKGQHGDIWIGNLDGGLDQFVASKQEFKHYLNDSKSGILQNSGVVAIFRDNKENIWIGLESQPGLYKLNPTTGSITAFTNKKNNSNSIPNSCVQTIMQDNQGKIWIGLKQGGISVLENEQSQLFMNYIQKDGIPGTTTYGIVEDGNKNLWISTDNGICVFERNKNIFRSFDKSDGLQSLEFAMNATYKDKNGFIYFGGSDGFNRFHPDNIIYNTHIPNVFISSFKIFNKEVEANKVQNGKIYFSKPIYLTDTLFLDRHDNVFSLEFTAVDYASPEKNKFAYRLEGLEKDWNYVDASKRMATYSNLAPGTYIFHVKASNNDGLWNEAGCKLTIIVIPAWWQTWWFKAIFFFIILIAIYTYSYYRVKRIKRRAALLKQEVVYRTFELQEANILLTDQKQEIVRQYDRILEQQKELVIKKTELEDTNLFLETSNNQKSTLISVVSHDIRGPVNNFLSLMQLGQKVANEEVKEILSMAKNQATSLVQMTTSLLQWAMFQRNKSDLHKEPVNIADLCRELKEEINPFAQAKNIDLDVHISESIYVLADRNSLKTIIRNICSNAIKYSPINETVSLFAEEIIAEEKVRIIVRDNGLGIEPEKIADLFRFRENKKTRGTAGEQGAGVALVFADELIKLNDGRLEVESELGKGSTFSIFIPMFATVTTYLENKPSIIPPPLDSDNIDISSEQLENYKQILQRKIVFLVEDDEVLRHHLKLFLCEIVEVHDFNSAEAAFAELINISPDLIIADLNLPLMSGFELVEKIKSDSLTSHISCFILTGEERTDSMALGYQYGIDSYLTKPLNKLELMERITRYFIQQQQRIKRYSIEVDTEVGTLSEDPLNKLFLEKLVQLIENRLSDSTLNAQILCNEMGMSRSALYQKLKILTGESVNDFIKVVRLRRSLGLLKKRNLNISEIAYETGFNSPSYFTSSFRKHFGFSPSEFLKKT
jgi:ligand-binding sensor domain-containing protein/signal transduction histidine kinase/DNA-binding response OmpR family regulator